MVSFVFSIYVEYLTSALQRKIFVLQIRLNNIIYSEIVMKVYIYINICNSGIFHEYRKIVTLVMLTVHKKI